MPRRRFDCIALALLLLGGYAVLFGHSSLTEDAQAQSASPSSGAAPSGAAPTTPTQSPTVNPSCPNTVQQPSYTPSTPSSSGTTPTTPSSVSNGEAISAPNENSESTTAGSERQTSVAKTRSAHHQYRGRSALVTYACEPLGCVRTYAWAFPCQCYSRYCAPLYDYAGPAPVVVTRARGGRVAGTGATKPNSPEVSPRHTGPDPGAPGTCG